MKEKGFVFFSTNQVFPENLVYYFNNKSLMIQNNFFDI